MKQAWWYKAGAWTVNWFERGDLVPLMILVSAVHYASVLQGKDALPVAVAIGLLVDLGHYRTVRSAVRYQTARPATRGRTGRAGAQRRTWRWQMAARLAIAAGMTVVSLAYHQRYYQDWWLSAPLPLLIAALAWLRQVEPAQPAKREPVRSEEQPAAPQIELLPVAKPLLPEPAQLGWVCACGYAAGSQAALNGHQRAHRKRQPAEVNP
jgi:hypothetical protein